MKAALFIISFLIGAAAGGYGILLRVIRVEEARERAKREAEAQAPNETVPLFISKDWLEALQEDWFRLGHTGGIKLDKRPDGTFYIWMTHELDKVLNYEKKSEEKAEEKQSEINQMLDDLFSGESD